MNFNFELILFWAVVVTGVVWAIDRFIFQAKRQGAVPSSKAYVLVDYSRSFLPILLIVLLIRSFIVEPFRIPSGSLEPTLRIGDFIVVNKYHYGLRLPVLKTKIVTLNEPKIGDIAVFRWPVDTSIDFIKRIIATPGDRLSYKNKVLFVNGKEAPQVLQRTLKNPDEKGRLRDVIQKSETINGVVHNIYVRDAMPARDFNEIVIPKGYYFAMGDNRDDSSDSRYWGLVPEKNLVGRAMAVWFSWDSVHHSVRWNRIGSVIH